MNLDTVQEQTLVGPKEGYSRVFVYGTLKRNFGNHSWYLRDAKFCGNAQLIGYVMRHLGAYPAIVPWAKDGLWSVHGEVYEVSPEALNSLDKLEGIPSLYQRTEVELPLYGKMYVYVMETSSLVDGRAFIPSGIWQGRGTKAYHWDASKKQGESFTEVVDEYGYQRPSIIHTPPPIPNNVSRLPVPVVTKKVEKELPNVGPGTEEA